MYKEVIKKIKPELEKTLNYLKRETDKIRAGRPSISLIGDLRVDYFGQTFLLKELGAISLAEGNQVIIQPWDKLYFSAIEKAVSGSNLDFSLRTKDDKIFLSLPPLTSEYRENLLKILSEKSENTRQTIRRWRTVAWDEIQELFRQKKISEDEKYRAKDELQDLIDEYNKKVEELTEIKRKETTL